MIYWKRLKPLVAPALATLPLAFAPQPLLFSVGKLVALLLLLAALVLVLLARLLVHVAAVLLLVLLLCYAPGARAAHGIALFGESAEPTRLFFIALIVAGIAGLKLVTP